MTDHNSQSGDKSANLKSPNLKSLSPWNPLDHLRLLWWVLVTPQWLVAYRETFGENAERRVSKWLVSTLNWSSFFILALTLGLGTFAGAETVHLSAISLWASVGLTLAWALMGRLGDRDDDNAVFLLVFSVALGVLGVMGVVRLMADAVVGGIAAVMVALLVFAVAGPITFVMVGKTTRPVGAIVATAVALGVLLAIGRKMAGFEIRHVERNVMFVWVYYIVARSVANRLESVLEESLQTGHPSWLARGAFGVMLLAYAFLLWFSFLGGWKVFR